jgi:hypothetical protein
VNLSIIPNDSFVKKEQKPFAHELLSDVNGTSSSIISHIFKGFDICMKGILAKGTALAQLP